MTGTFYQSIQTSLIVEVPITDFRSPSPPPLPPAPPAPTELLAAIVESSDDAIISKTLQGIITSWNAGAERLFGYTAQEAIGRSILMIIPDDRKHEEDMILGRLRRGERIDHFETVRMAKNGRLIDISLTISPIRNDRGELVGASKVARDITEQKRVQRELREGDTRKNEFLALLAHELRNPLGPIRHAVKILRARAPSPDELQWATNIIDRQTEHMVRLVDDLLDVSRITRGAIELRRERIDVASVLRSAVEASSAHMERAGHQLRMTPPAEPLYVEGDATRLTQVLTNLLDNAAKYTDPGGHIWLSAEREGEQAVIVVKDSGIGIDPDVLPRIFDMFTQAGGSVERAQGGLGVGLALVERLVKLHGGSVSAYSAGPGRGSEFTVRLPLAVAHRPAPERTARPVVATTTRCKVLVVDDNLDSADSLAMLLRMMGHDVQTSNDGEDALREAAAFQPHVAILDIGLPKMNGYDLAREIRAQPWAREIVLVALTGWGQDQHRRRSAESGFNHHLTKPLDLNVLQQILAEADTCTTDGPAAR
ncbi:MAG TPA: ATP-binding protein [Gemmatimonadales bacterium]|nr:ATP-binding protein [Gemmatimonadales bacterium]